ncbi:MAG: type II secretion system secretin GspD, partial [Rhodospirillaceae bacterium]|nr:type II secretion system secretin GspD [Rhodospirillaceae bacterium]
QHSIRRSIGAAVSSARPAFILACLGAASALAQAQQIMPNYRNADIRQIIEAVGEVTGRNFLIDPRVNADVTLVSFSPMSPEAFYEAFLATLQVHAFVAVESGELVKIVPDANARILPGADPGAAGDQIVTQVVALDNVGAAQLVPILRPLVAQYGHLAAHPTSNTLIIADRAANVNRMLGILARMDQGGEEDIEVIRLQNASATEVVTMLTALNQAAAAAGGAPAAQIAADNRTNSVLLSGPQNSRLRFRALVAHLDTPTENGGTTQVRYLNYANAEELATNLQTQFGGVTAEGAPDAPPEGISIWADVGTNALIISADPRTMQDMNAVIDRLDIRRAQVQVDAIIVEMSESRANELGVTWAIQGADGDPAALTNFPSTAAGVAQLGAAVSASETPNASLLPEGLLTAVGRIRDDGTSWAAVLTALAGDASTNIIATPTIVTLDNEQAEINVGQQVPFLTGQFTNTGAATGAVNPFQTIQREDVGTRLAITPQINEGSGVKLLIEQEQSSISRGVQGAGAVDLITNRRTITTSVFVEDGHILVLGGLIDDQLRSGEDRVPVLGRIPGIGALFRSQSTELVKVNLMVFIRPTILRDSVQAAFQTNAKYRYLRDLQLQQAERPVPLMNDEQRPTLPELPAEQPQAPTE